MGRPPSVPLLALAAVAVLAVLWVVYSPAFEAPFYLDSWFHLFEKSTLRLVELTPSGLLESMRLDHGQRIYRPLPNLSLALTHYWARLDPRPYRIGNVLIHWFAFLSLVFFFSSALAAPRVRRSVAAGPGHGLVLAFIAAAAWCLHPVQTNAVTYVIQRMASLEGLFSFLTVGAYLRARSAQREWSWGWGGLGLLGLLLALASKENAVVLFPALAASEWLLLDPPGRSGVRWGLRAAAALLALAGFAALVHYGPSFWTEMEAAFVARGHTPWERLLTEVRLQIRYLTVLLIPDPRLLSLDAEVEVSRTLLHPPETLAAVLAAAGSLFLAWRLSRTRPLLSFGIVWFFVTQAVEGTILPLELYFEHRLYVPSVFLFLGLACLAGRARGARRSAVALAVTLTLAVFGVECWATAARNAVWADPVRFWSDAVAKAPDKPRPYTNLADVLLRAGLPGDAREAVHTAISLGGPPGPNRYFLARIAYELGDVPLARSHLIESIRAGGSFLPRAQRALASLQVESGELAAAADTVDEILRGNPLDPEAWYLKGAVTLRRGEAASAEMATKTALRLDPGCGRCWNLLGAAYQEQGKAEDAAACYRKAYGFEPDEGYLRNWRELTGSTGGPDSGD